jgi:hypothetical protein
MVIKKQYVHNIPSCNLKILEINKNIYTKTLKFQLVFSKKFTKVQWRGRMLGSQTWKLNTKEKLEELAQCPHK